MSNIPDLPIPPSHWLDRLFIREAAPVESMDRMRYSALRSDAARQVSTQQDPTSEKQP